jgi:hypothetical protein
VESQWISGGREFALEMTQADSAENPPSGRDFDMLDIVYQKARRCA